MTAIGTTIKAGTEQFNFLYQIDLGQVLIAILLLCILVVLIMWWLGDWIYRR